MESMTNRELQAQIMAELEVVTDFEAQREAERRINFLVGYLKETGTKGYVLGISGGIDSTVAGRLCQLACERARAEGLDATFVAVRLPYQVQRDEAEAARAIEFIRPDEAVTLNIGAPTDAMWQAVIESNGVPNADQLSEFVKGNVKARQRMIAQFAIAGARRMLVVGTDQAAEALVGFYTKFGDGAADLTPLTGLPKRRVRELGAYLGCPVELVNKVPTADLESDKPLRPDEVALGVDYQAIDTYLEGGGVTEAEEEVILGWYRRTAHKRALPLTPGQWEVRQQA